MTETSLGKRIVVITGATGGLGSSVTDRFRTSDTAVTISRSGSDFSADLTDPVSAQRTVEEVAGKMGRIDVLIHVMGGFAAGGPVAETSVDIWQQMMDLNFYAALHVIRNVLPHMIAAGTGRIVAVGSRTGAQPTAGLSAYGVSKSALNALIQTVALEVKDKGITANVVMPGTMRTKATVQFGKPEEIETWVEPASVAELIYWLASDAAKDVNGALIPIYGRS